MVELNSKRKNIKCVNFFLINKNNLDFKIIIFFKY